MKDFLYYLYFLCGAGALGLLLFFPFPLTVQGIFWWEPRGKRHQVVWYGKVHYLLWTKKRGFRRFLSDAELVEKWLPGDSQKKGKPRFSVLSLLKGKKARPRFQIRFFGLEMKAGTGNAAYTALLYGMAWNIRSLLAAGLKEYLAFDASWFQVQPDYEETGVQVQLKCIISLCLAQIIGITGNFLLGTAPRPNGKRYTTGR